jgi:hypothetical protein
MNCKVGFGYGSELNHSGSHLPASPSLLKKCIPQPRFSFITFIGLVIFTAFVFEGPEKRHIPHKVVDSGNGVFRIEFTTVEVGSYVIDVTVSGKVTVITS